MRKKRAIYTAYAFCRICDDAVDNNESIIEKKRLLDSIEDNLKLTLSGIDIHLYHAPGETNDQIFVWLPKFKALFPGDNFYRAFPNLYTGCQEDLQDSYRALAGAHRAAPMVENPVDGGCRRQPGRAGRTA